MPVAIFDEVTPLLSLFSNFNRDNFNKAVYGIVVDVERFNLTLSINPLFEGHLSSFEKYFSQTDSKVLSRDKFFLSQLIDNYQEIKDLFASAIVKNQSLFKKPLADVDVSLAIGSSDYAGACFSDNQVAINLLNFLEHISVDFEGDSMPLVYRAIEKLALHEINHCFYLKNNPSIANSFLGRLLFEGLAFNLESQSSRAYSLEKEVSAYSVAIAHSRILNSSDIGRVTSMAQEVVSHLSNEDFFESDRFKELKKNFSLDDYVGVMKDFFFKPRGEIYTLGSAIWSRLRADETLDVRELTSMPGYLVLGKYQRLLEKEVLLLGSN